ncbi:hypothetical protein [Pararhizobium polonicum]|uniref:hypothetical protein n=1 Tax=Pararhizobium polonicum TaxID=1612624 RepID=UPI000A864238|nr:hypothetical protein [Pararhizobium polonicum]
MPEEPATDQTVRLAFEKQASACRGLGSPFTAQLCTLAAGRLTARRSKRPMRWTGCNGGFGPSTRAMCM